jgi:transposase
MSSPPSDCTATTRPCRPQGQDRYRAIMVYVRDEDPFSGPAPPAALFHYSRDRRGQHPRAHLAGWSGILLADAYGGYGELYAPGRQLGPVLEAGCFANASRRFFEPADVEGAARKKSRGEQTGLIFPMALEAVQRLDALFNILRHLLGCLHAPRGAPRCRHQQWARHGGPMMRLPATKCPGPPGGFPPSALIHGVCFRALRQRRVPTHGSP